MWIAVQFALRLTFAGLLYAVLAIGPVWFLTGSLSWPRGWLAIGVLVATQAVFGVWLLRRDPELLASRMAAEGNDTRDKLATALIALLLLGWFVGNPIDVHALKLLPALSAVVSIGAGLVLFAAGIALVMWTLATNTFDTSVVAVQDERGQRVIDTGPYARVRHPLYAGMIPALMGLSLVMGSTAMALLVIPMVLVGFLPRMLIEEATLRRDLDGYDDYIDRVRARLVPGVM